MSSWTAAHRVAHMVAVRARDELAVPPGYPVDVFGAIAAADMTIMWKPMPRLLGAYFDDPGGEPGVLLNPNLAPAVRRHTAAHELGHHRFGHGTQLDRDDDDHLTSPHTSWPLVEKQAEAFAAWFLMPLMAIRAAVARLGFQTVTSPAEVYQLALRLGTPYRTTARHLGHARIVPASRTTRWMQARPDRLKAELDHAAAPPASRHHDVWLVDCRADGDHLVVAPSDRLVVLDADRVHVGDPGSIIELAQGADARGRRSIVLEASAAAAASAQLISASGPRSWDFVAEVRPAPAPGLDPLMRK